MSEQPLTDTDVAANKLCCLEGLTLATTQEAPNVPELHINLEIVFLFFFLDKSASEFQQLARSVFPLM